MTRSDVYIYKYIQIIFFASRYMKAGRDTALAECREKQTDMEQKAEVLDTKRNTLAGKIEKRREDLQTQKV